MEFKRYAVYYAPPGPPDRPKWADFCTRWLGWDMGTGASGSPVAHPDLAGLPRSVDEITAAPRKYGLHGTIKPPFRLANGQTPDGLQAACAALCADLAAVRMDGLQLARLGRFLALRPRGAPDAVNTLAAACVRRLDPFRAPATPAELERRRAPHLSPAQDANLSAWGYPHVMDDFRFHITLTGRLPNPDLAAVETALHSALTPLLPAPFTIDALVLTGEDDTGRFHLIQRYSLTG